MSASASEMYLQILDNLPHVVLRLTYAAPKWDVVFVNRAVERYGYTKGDFGPGKMTWNDLLHPDDRVVALKQSADYMKNGIDDFKIQYRVVTKGGASLYITEYSHVNRNPDGAQGSIDTLMIENLEARAVDSLCNNTAVSRNLALNDILLTL